MGFSRLLTILPFPGGEIDFRRFHLKEKGYRAERGLTLNILRLSEPIPSIARGAVIAIGNFDGVHLGHQKVIGEAAYLATTSGRPLGVLSFEPHPRRFFQRHLPPFRLSRLSDKALYLAALGVNYLFLQRFHRGFAALSAADFEAEILARRLQPKHLFVGANFAYGAGRKGQLQDLARAGEVAGYQVHIVPALEDETGITISSSRIREALLQGEVKRAAALLGRPWEISGRVMQGEARGRSIGFPTANIGLNGYQHPAYGVYAAKVAIQNATGSWQSYDGVLNIGLRPTVGGERARLEVHLFDFAGDLYGKCLRVAFIGYLRPEMRFPNLAALTAEIEKDCVAAREALASAPAGLIASTVSSDSI